MLASDKLKTEIAELRSKMLGFAKLDTLTPEQRSELDTLTTTYEDRNKQYDAALIAEREDLETRQNLFNQDDAQGAEVRSLMGKVQLTDYLQTAKVRGPLTGAPAELNKALGAALAGDAGGPIIPFALLAPPEQRAKHEDRAFTSTTQIPGATTQMPIMQRLFGPSILGLTGVTMNAAALGSHEYPLVTNGVAPASKTEGTAADAPVAMTIGVRDVLRPKKITGSYEWTHEVAARVEGIEAALRNDLAQSVDAELSSQALTGDPSSNAAQFNGFFTKITAPTTPTTVVSFGDVAGLAASAVTGIEATAESEINVLLGVQSYQTFASLYRAGAGSDESALENLTRRARAVRASSYIAAPASDVQQALLYAAGPGRVGDSIGAVWNGGPEVVLDPYTKASQGVVLTWILMADMETAHRAGAYSRAAFKLS